MLLQLLKLLITYVLKYKKNQAIRKQVSVKGDELFLSLRAKAAIL